MKWQEHLQKFKLKSVSGKKQQCIQTPEASKKTQQSSKLTQQHLIFPKRPKIRVHMAVLSKSTYISHYLGKTRVYMRLWKQNLHTRRKIETNKLNRQAEKKFTLTGHYWTIMPPYPTQKQRNQINSSTMNAEKSPKKNN